MREKRLIKFKEIKDKSFLNGFQEICRKLEVFIRKGVFEQ